MQPEEHNTHSSRSDSPAEAVTSDESRGMWSEFALWLKRAGQGDEAAISELLLGMREYLLAVAQGELDVELRAKVGPSDVVQETFVQALRGFHRFRGSSAAELRAWLRQILLHRIDDTRDAYRTEKRDIRRETVTDRSGTARDSINQIRHSDSTPSFNAILTEEDARVAAALGRLPPEYQEVIRLRNWQGLDFELIGIRTGRSSAAARKLFYRAIVKLSELLD